MSAEDFLLIGETEERYQLVEGVVVRMSRPTSKHQAVLKNLIVQLHPCEQQGLAAVFVEVDWRIRENAVYSPDIACFRADRSPGLPTHLRDTPDLVIEVLSPSTMLFDMLSKKDDYERAGVGEYWTIDPKDARVRCYRRHEGSLVEVLVKGDSLASTALPGFTLDLRPLRELAGRE